MGAKSPCPELLPQRTHAKSSPRTRLPELSAGPVEFFHDVPRGTCKGDAVFEPPQIVAGESVTAPLERSAEPDRSDQRGPRRHVGGHTVDQLPSEHG